MEVVNKINISNDYSSFKISNSNRACKILNSKTLTNIEKSILKYDLTEFYPILIDRNNYIIDGQHRFFVCKKHNKPIYYIKSEVIDIEKDTDILIRCNIQEKQTVSDLIKMLTGKNKEVTKAVEFAHKHQKFPLSVIVELLYSKASGSGFRSVLDEQRYKIRYENELVEIITYIESLNVNKDVNKYSRAFLIAIARIYYTSQVDLIKIKAKEKLIKSHNGYNNYLNHFMFLLGNYERVYG